MQLPPEQVEDIDDGVIPDFEPETAAGPRSADQRGLQMKDQSAVMQRQRKLALRADTRGRADFGGQAGKGEPAAGAAEYLLAADGQHQVGGQGDDFGRRGQFRAPVTWMPDLTPANTLNLLIRPLSICT